MVKLKNWFYDKFGFSKKEFNGVLALFVILFIVTVLPYAYHNINRFQAPLKPAEIIALQKLQLVKNNQQANFYDTRERIENSEARPKSQLFQFDPNKIDVGQWQQLGLSFKQASSIVNYTKKGGKFYKPEDLQKMYTITKQKYQELMPYVVIENQPSKFNANGYEKREYVKKTIQIIDINNADTLTLDEIKGVGAAFARRIANYRDRIGGFYKKEQLLEVYGVDSLKFNEIKNQIVVDPSNIKKININTVQFNDLKTNPYLSYKQMNAIINYRKQHGDYKGVDDLKKVILLSPQVIQNLTPYLTF